MDTQVKELYGWSSVTINLLVAWGPIIYIPLVLVSPYFIDRLGLRASVQYLLLFSLYISSQMCRNAL
jgi:hypothetical protein